MSLLGKSMGLLVSVAPDHPSFRHALGLAEAALNRGVKVYLYCLDEGVRGVSQPTLQSLRTRGLILYACAYGAQKRHLPVTEAAVYGGLGILSDVMACTDRFLSFN